MRWLLISLVPPGSSAPAGAGPAPMSVEAEASGRIQVVQIRYL